MHFTGRYTLPLDVVTLLERTKLSAHALRLFHGLYYCMDLATEGNPTQIPAVFHTAKKMRCGQLRLDVATPGTNDNDWIRRAIPELQDTKLFDVLSLSPNGRYLEFRPAKLVKNASGSVKRFAPMRTAHLKACRSVHDILFLARAALHGGGKWPTWYLARIGSAPFAEPWEDSRDNWIASAVKVSKLLGHDYLVAPTAGPLSMSVDSVKVKASHSETQWKTGTLYVMPAGSRPFPIVAGTKYRPLTAAEMKARVDWRTIQAEEVVQSQGRRRKKEAAVAVTVELGSDQGSSAQDDRVSLAEEEFPF